MRLPRATLIALLALTVTPASARSVYAGLRARADHAHFMDGATGRLPTPGDAGAIGAVDDGHLHEAALHYYDRTRCGAAPIDVRIVPLALGPSLPAAKAVILTSACFGPQNSEIAILDRNDRRLWDGPATAVAVLPHRGRTPPELTFRGWGEGKALSHQIWSWNAGTQAYDFMLDLDNRDYDAEQRSLPVIGPL